MLSKIVFIYLSCAVLSACSHVSAVVYQSEFSAYAEQVFRRQNSMTSRIMMAASDMEEESDALQQVEMEMHDACSLLNQYSEKEANNEKISVSFKNRVKNSIPDCDASIDAVEQQLKQVK